MLSSVSLTRIVPLALLAACLSSPLSETDTVGTSLPDPDTTASDDDTADSDADSDTSDHSSRTWDDIDCDTTAPFVPTWPDPSTYNTSGQAGATCDVPTADTYRVAVFRRDEARDCILPPHFVSRPLEPWRAYAEQPNLFTHRGTWPRPVVGGGCAMPPADVGPVTDPGFLTDCPAGEPDCCAGHNPDSGTLCEAGELGGLLAMGYLGHLATRPWCLCEGDPVVPVYGALYDSEQECWAEGNYFGPAETWRESSCRAACEDAPMSYIHPNGTCLVDGSSCPPQGTEPPCGELTLYDGDELDCPDATRRACPR